MNSGPAPGQGRQGLDPSEGRVAGFAVKVVHGGLLAGVKDEAGGRRASGELGQQRDEGDGQDGPEADHGGQANGGADGLVGEGAKGHGMLL